MRELVFVTRLPRSGSTIDRVVSVGALNCTNSAAPTPNSKTPANPTTSSGLTVMVFGSRIGLRGLPFAPDGPLTGVVRAPLPVISHRCVS